jgi:hypothetical protein
VYIAENSAVGTQVVNLNSATYVYDQDGDTMTFSLLAGNKNGALSLSRSGSLTVKNSSALNYEARVNSWNLTIQVTDDGQNGKFANKSSIDYLTVGLTNVNEAPSLTSGQVLYVFENASVNSVVGTLTGSDPDSGQNLFFSLASSSSAFILTVAGQLKVASTLSYVKTPSYNLRVTVTDSGSPSLSSTGNVTIMVRKVNYAPELTTKSTTVGYVYEKTKGAWVTLASGRNFTLNFTDANQGTGETYKFYISGGTGKGRFILYPSLGVIQVNSSASTIVFQTNPTFTLTCYVQDSTGLKSSSVTYTITTLNVIDPAVLSNLTISTVAKVSAGTVLSTPVTPFYIEPGDSCSYRLSRVNANFSISATGYVTVIKALPDSNRTYSLPYYCLNSKGAPSNNATLKIRAISGYQAPTLRTRTFTVRESASVGTTITRNLTTLVTNTAPYSYTFTLRTFTSVFSVNSTTGAIKTLQTLNFNTAPKYNLTVTVASAGPGNLASTGYIGITVIDTPNAPVFTFGSATFRIAETARPGTNISTPVMAYDQDAGQGASLNYTMSPKYPSIPFSIRRYYNATAQTRYGQIYLDPRGTYPQLDYYSASSYLVTVVVTDRTGLSSSTFILIQVSLVNTPPTVPNYVFSVAESAGVGTTVGTIVASDRESNSLSYSIIKGNTGSAFSITNTGSSAVLKLASALDYETLRSYNLTVRVLESSTEAYSVLSIVLVSVIDVNDLTITSITSSFGSTYATAGGTQVTITGTNFGPVSSSLGVSVSASYQGSDSYAYQATNCIIVTPNTVITCTTAVGVGTGQSWFLTVSAPGTTSWTTVSTTTYGYVAPSISFVAVADGSTSLSTSGGTQIAIFGTNFGPARKTVLGSSLADIVKVSVGTSSASLPYSCSNAYVANNSISLSGVSGGTYDRIVCTLGEGAGKNLFFTVSIGTKPQESSWTLTSSAYQSSVAYAKPSISRLVGPVLSTTGGNTITLTGSNFGPADGTVAVSAIYGSSLVGYYTATGCSVVRSHVNITCTTVVGIGWNLTWIVTVAGQTSPRSSATNRYVTPSLSTIRGTGASQAITTGGQLFTITGSHFGPTTSTAKPVVTYGDTGTEYIASSCTVTLTDTQIVCLTGEGTGADLMTIVKIGGQPSSAFAGNMSFAAPVVQYYVTQWDDTSATGGRTEGGQYVLIYGSNFGTKEENNVDMVTYGPTGAEYIPCASPKNCNCSVVTDHTVINCTTVAGTGSDQKWIVYIHDQESTVPATSYATPAISTITGAGSVNASVYGGQLITITGTNFGPSQSKLDSVTYGPGGTEYKASGCTLTTLHKAIRCLTAAGVGKDLKWMVTVDGQSSSASTTTTNYKQPAISSMTAYTSLTSGGGTVTITGTNFGAGVAFTYVEVYMSGTVVALDGQSTTTAVAGKSAYFGTNSAGSEYIIFTVPEMTNQEQKKFVRVLVASTTVAGASQYSPAVAFTYGSPYITSIQNVQGTDIRSLSTSNLVIQGRNFGASGTIYFNGVAVDSSSGVANLAWGHSRITLTVIGSSGTIYVQVGTEVSNSVDFSDSSPKLLYGYSQYTPSSSAYLATGKTSAGSSIFLTFAGTPTYGPGTARLGPPISGQGYKLTPLSGRQGNSLARMSRH